MDNSDRIIEQKLSNTINKVESKETVWLTQTCNKCGRQWQTPINVHGVDPVYDCGKCKYRTK